MSDCSRNAWKVPDKPVKMRDIDQVKALLGVVVFELGLLIGICWAICQAVG